MKPFRVRNGRRDDYEQYLAMEKIAWAGSDIEPIDETTFNTWITTFPDGCISVVDQRERLAGFIASQLCQYNPRNPTDTQRNYNDISSHGNTAVTHDPQGNTLYILSNSATAPGAGYKALATLCALTQALNKQYCVGACRLPGLQRVCMKHNIVAPNRDFVLAYVAEIMARVPKAKRTYGPDPVLSVSSRYPNVQAYDVVKHFLPMRDWQSFDWSCVIGWKNLQYIQ